MPSSNSVHYGRQFSEKRRELRMLISAKACLNNQTDTYLGLSHDLSAHGCALILEQALPLNADYQLSLQTSVLRSENHQLQANFKVIRVCQRGDKEFLIAGLLSNVT